MTVIVDMKDIIGLVILCGIAIISICIYIFYWFCSLGEKIKKRAMDKKVNEENKHFTKKDIEAYEKLIESEIGFGEGEE